MNGDGMAGLAIAIFVAMIAIVFAGFGVAFFAGRVVGRRTGWGANKTGLAFAITGLGVGFLIVIATFFETTFSPPPKVVLETPPGFAYRWVVLLEDPSASTVLTWTGVEVPFFGKSTAVAVPPSGILRVRDLGGVAGRGDLTVAWSDGSVNVGLGGGPAPKSTGATLYNTFAGARAGLDEEPPVHDDALFAAYIAARESPKR